MRDKRSFAVSSSFLDVLFIVLLCVVVLFALQSKNQRDEYARKVDLLKRKPSKQITGEDGIHIPTVTVIPSEAGAIFELSEKEGAIQRLTSREQIRAYLKRLHPSQVKYRIDKNIPTGVSQALFLDASDLGIRPLIVIKEE